MNRPIAILGGTGPQGLGLALRWAKAGETIIIGSRDPKRAEEAAAFVKQKIGIDARITGMENATACAGADICVLTVPFDAQAALLKQLKPVFQPGTTLIDATVPLAATVGGRPTRVLGVWQGSAAQQAAELVPKAISVVAAFHNVSADLLNGAGALDCDVIVCSDDDNARNLTFEPGLPGLGRAAANRALGAATTRVVRGYVPIGRTHPARIRNICAICELRTLT
jgi:NADPH-dependent F420 reductase